uniref:Gfo/Idh/MocA-like oxidoreductase N-terminal domain-containing protein n=2 Tax=Corethron hystrix TaxID=216773 RepID=A0A7S1BTK9_9STRA|eukprot:CAMPEP_0113299502 /NCGR_PEP_ID=MMETSP0010_2-20120614/1513_1 /TAXON_ID=216773 ORGANISM="Corethron hystrix, Strain 308" /NCGR_SAMPLE_ID=MMETSP0010_2 /ASSEMBLY_ACC=CAM_ASM_000155 /LENGTH=393 /DNA_ID=CAMNT_0000152753 /DNA_START=54 /DNA_END=1235 /DNA_ORIENTATION=- /assembly_acc=CAM_ASM_000155
MFSSASAFVTKRPVQNAVRRALLHSTAIAPASKGQAEVVLVGCGMPNRGMGWYHAVQMIEKRCPSASLDFVVEPWFLGGGKDTPGGKDFAAWQKEVEGPANILFTTSLTDLPAPVEPRVALISGRTADNPRLLTESIAGGCKTIYLEKPGAPTVTELEAMAAEAKAAGVEVLMGYNKNVCKYVTKTREFAATVPGSHTTFVSNNAYENTPESLGECFERNAEGMLKNMAIHELALLVSFYDVSVDNIESVTADKEFSSMQTLPGPSGKEFTDFDKIKFTIKTKTGKSVSVAADRCGGTDSYATVQDGSSDEELFRYYMPDEEDKAEVDALMAQYPDAMPYFFTQDKDYITVKERVAKFCADGSEATGVATIDIAVETLKVAEYLTPSLMEQLK